MHLKIGCTGWNYEGWKDTFYPKNMDPSQHLKFYSSIFEITEINSTFYRIPSVSMAEKWNRDTPENFQFTAKIPKQITHEGRLKPGPYLDQFLASIKPLGKKMSALVIQIPPSLSFAESEPQLAKMFRHLPDTYRYVVEGRHDSWFSDQAYGFLSDHKVTLAWNEVSGVDNPAPVTSDLAYLRLIGDRSISEKEFGKVQKDRSGLVKRWADKLKQVSNQVSLGIMMANNHFEGFGPATANKLRLQMGLEQLVWADTKQKSLSDFKK